MNQPPVIPGTTEYRKYKCYPHTNITNTDPTKPSPALIPVCECGWRDHGHVFPLDRIDEAQAVAEEHVRLKARHINN